MLYSVTHFSQNNNLFENAHHLCYMQSFITTNQNANSVSSQSNINLDSLISCIDISKSTWYKFSTNNVGGNADLLISQINCTGDSNLVYQNKVQAVVFSYSISDSTSVFKLLKIVRKMMI